MQLLDYLFPTTKAKELCCKVITPPDLVEYTCDYRITRDT